MKLCALLVCGALSAALASAGQCDPRCGQCPPAGVAAACCHGGSPQQKGPPPKCETAAQWNKDNCVQPLGMWCTSDGPEPAPTPAPPAPAPTPPGPAPAGGRVQWTGVNLAGFDYGNLARAGAVWCTDADCSSGGWSDPRTPEDGNCPGYGGDNKTATYLPAKDCSPSGSDVPLTYNGGFGAPRDFEVANFGVGTSAVNVAIPAYARASPVIDEPIAAAQFGVNSFRVPFRIEYVKQLWEGTWMADQNLDHPEYLPPHPHYLQMVVDYIEAILTKVPAPAAAKAPVSVVFDMHNYMRWCPMGIGGTWSCLEQAGYDGKIKYDTNRAATSCPLSSVFPNHASFDGVCPKAQTPEQAAHYWDAAPDAADFAGTADYGMQSGWKCPLDEASTPPSDSRRETCGLNNKAPPSASDGQENPFAKVLTSTCWGRIWDKLLKLPVSSKAFPGQCVPLHQVLGHYADESKPSIAIGLMNEPNMVDTDALAAAYKDVVSNMRGNLQLRNRLLVMGNYWGGLHAQVTPGDRSSSSECGSPSSEANGHTADGKMPLQIVHEALKDIPNLAPWTFEAHQYLDYDSTGNYDCDAGWPANKSSCATGTVEQVKDFVNWEPFMAYCRKNDISVAITEFGGHPTARCNTWLKSFLQIMQDDAYVEGQGGVLMWQLWRVCPHTSWYAGVTPQNPNADCVQFAQPAAADPPEFAQLWRVTSADSVSDGVKAAIKDFVQG